ncbi:protein rep [Streptomyces xiamenensis]
MQVSGLTERPESGSDPKTVAGVTGGPDTADSASQTTGQGFSGGIDGAVTIQDTEARDRRFTLREDLRKLSRLARLQKCGAAVLQGGVVPVIRNGRAGFRGVVTCGSVHVCPCCGSSIRAARQEELDAVGVAWECQSCGLAMMTLTMRHFLRQLLAVLVEQQRAAWKLAFGQNAGRAWRDAKKKYGIRGFVRAWEVTHGEANGWHAHYHVLLFLDRPWTREQRSEVEAIAYTAWSEALEKVGAYLPSEAHGVRIDAPDRGEAGKMARYLMKNQDGKAAWGAAAELTRQDIKQGQNGHRTPFQIGAAAVAEDADQRDVELWLEFEAAATGIRSLYWSNGLRKYLADMGIKLDKRNDDQVAADEHGHQDAQRIALIPAETWYRHIVHVKGRALALLKAAEKGGVSAVRQLAESWGLVWGADIFEAEALDAPGAILTADEVMRRLERTHMTARAAAWRCGFDQADLADRRKALEEKDFTEAASRVQAASLRRAQASETESARLKATGEVPARWWEEYEDQAVRARAMDEAKTAPAGIPNQARETFLIRRRKAIAARPEQVQLGMDRYRDPAAELPMKVSLRKPLRAPRTQPLSTPTPSRPKRDCTECGKPIGFAVFADVHLSCDPEVAARWDRAEPAFEDVG